MNKSNDSKGEGSELRTKKERDFDFVGLGKSGCLK